MVTDSISWPFGGKKRRSRGTHTSTTSEKRILDKPSLSENSTEPENIYALGNKSLSMWNISMMRPFSSVHRNPLPNMCKCSVDRKWATKRLKPFLLLAKNVNKNTIFILFTIFVFFFRPCLPIFCAHRTESDRLSEDEKKKFSKTQMIRKKLYSDNFFEACFFGYEIRIIIRILIRINNERILKG